MCQLARHPISQIIQLNIHHLQYAFAHVGCSHMCNREHCVLYCETYLQVLGAHSQHKQNSFDKNTPTITAVNLHGAIVKVQMDSWPIAIPVKKK